MKILALLASIILSFSVAGSSQQATGSGANSTQAITLLTQSAAGLTVSGTFSDVTLTGSVHWIAGSDDETGTAVFKALASAAGRADLSLSSGPRSEVRNLSGIAPAGFWSGPDNISHAIAYHNLMTEPAWFFPAFAVARRLSGPGFIAAYVGHETHDGQAVEHVSVTQGPLSQAAVGVQFVQHLNQTDFFLDSASLLPVAMSFDTHPDSNALVDIPVEVQFSDYRSVNGNQVPFHIQKYLNNSLSLDFQANSVTVNTGLTESAFSIQ